MDFNEAAVFVKVVQAGSFSAAARQLQLPTSTVSTRVARLEQRLGVTLLQRTTRRLHLTEAGNAYFEHAALGLGHMLEAEAAIDAARQEPQGKLKITAPADLGDSMLSGLVQQVQTQYPALEVELVLTERYVDLVAEGVDAAIRTGQLRDSSLIARPLGIACWAAFASHDYLAQAPALREPQDLNHHHCLQFSPMGRDAWTFRRGPSSITVPLKGNTMANSIGIVRNMALSGQGVALLPTYICKPGLVMGDLERVLPEWQAQADPVHLVYPRQRFMPPKLRVFLDIAQAELRPWFSDNA
ncbi:LysR family transcriptional regulator [Methylobacillus arboreus]|uniref:LysR family transcriptional regulator n=1 Tax=Methylobacillus arboreus TaxID=755170 RepID=UPI001E397593|nr:LysR family transcriptional regulator [Methylobacillus arboreus]MCB5190786.1 LysR family transcriptional regulator [Methylobacillus arboreus]